MPFYKEKNNAKDYQAARLSLAGYNGTNKVKGIYLADHLIGKWWKTQIVKNVWYCLSSRDWWLLYSDAEKFVNDRVKKEKNED